MKMIFNDNLNVSSEENIHVEIDTNDLLDSIYRYYDTNDLNIIEKYIKEDLKNIHTALYLMEQFDNDPDNFIFLMSRLYPSLLTRFNKEIIKLLYCILKPNKFKLKDVEKTTTILKALESLKEQNELGEIK